jgi:hypothetical protein
MSKSDGRNRRFFANGCSPESPYPPLIVSSALRFTVIAASPVGRS